MARKAWLLMEDYAGGTRQRYRGQHKRVAERRIAASVEAGWPRSGFVIVTASSLDEAHEKAREHFRDRLRAELVERADSMGDTEFSMKSHRFRQLGGWWPRSLADWASQAGRELSADIVVSRTRRSEDERSDGGCGPEAGRVAG